MPQMMTTRQVTSIESRDEWPPSARHMRDGYLRGAFSPRATQRQMDVLAAFVAAGGSVQNAAELLGIRPSTVKRHLADLRLRFNLTTEQLIYSGRAEGWLMVPSFEPA
jgi:DNA-binding NarL/FixJ family response regulator